MALDIVGIGRAPLAAFRFVSRLQLQIAQLLSVQSRPGPRIAFAFAQQGNPPSSEPALSLPQALGGHVVQALAYRLR